MQSIAFTGVVKKLEVKNGSGGKNWVKFDLMTRKKFVSDEDKKNKTTNVFVPCTAFGGTAELIEKYIKEGDKLGVSNCEYRTNVVEKNGQKQYFHAFAVGEVDLSLKGFDDDSNGGGNASSSSDRGSRRGADRGASRRRETVPAEPDITDDDLPF